MKPVYLKMEAFGPYLKEQTVDFIEISKFGLFLIHGETGSGKTAILDAVTYALYGKSSGGGRGDITEMRSQNAPKNIRTFVEFTADIKGKTYKFVRSLEQNKKRHTVLVKNSDDIFEPLFENPKESDVNKTAVELIGLTYDQFSKVIMLPQGQFEQFLVAKSEEKEKILSTLFNVDKWQAVVENINEKVKNKRQKLNIEKESRDRIYADNNCKNLDELIVLLHENQKLFEAKDMKRAEISECMESLHKQYQAALSVDALFRRRDNTLRELKKLENERGKIEIIQQRLEKSVRANEIKPLYDNLLSASDNFNTRNKETYKGQETVERLKPTLEKAREKFKELQSKLGIFEDERAKLAKYTELVDTYEKLDTAKKKYENDKHEYDKLKQIVEEQEKQLKKVINDKIKDEKTAEAFEQAYDEAMKSYINNVAGILANDLKDDTPCPVCGSTAHPNLAEVFDSDISKEFIDAKKSQSDKIKARIIEIEKLANKIDEELSTKKEELAKLLLTKERSATEYDILLKAVRNADNDIENAAELRKEIRLTEKKIKNYEDAVKTNDENLKKIENDYNAAVSALSHMQTESQSAFGKLSEIKSIFEQKLADYKFDGIRDFTDSILDKAQYDKLTDTVGTHYTLEKSHKKIADDLEKELDGKYKPDIQKLEKDLKEVETGYASLLKEIGGLDQSVKNLDKLTAKLSKQEEQYIKDDEECRNNDIFALQIRGKVGMGVSLHRYILGVMLSSVTAEANRLLEEAYNGRYRLYRTLETTGRTQKAGLELEVYDNHTGGRRSVVSLSGGEKFLMSLALSIGLSTIVQSQSGGMSINAMFIDEGFGSLDSTSIIDAMTILANIRKSNKCVGIISHVQALKEMIDTKIEVIKGRNGSNIIFTGVTGNLW